MGAVTERPGERVPATRSRRPVRAGARAGSPWTEGLRGCSAGCGCGGWELGIGLVGQCGVRFDVVEMFHGTPSGPGNVTDELHIAQLLDTEIAAGRIPPVIAALPTTYEHQSSECVDAVRGERDETFLAVDVPADVEARFPVVPGRSFAAFGYSTGGFCAVNLALHPPDRYAAAASLSGYFTAGTAPGTSRLHPGNRTALLRNSPLWWVSHRPATAPPLYLFASIGDHTRPNRVRQEAGHAAAIRSRARDC